MTSVVSKSLQNDWRQLTRSFERSGGPCGPLGLQEARVITPNITCASTAYLTHRRRHLRFHTWYVPAPHPTTASLHDPRIQRIQRIQRIHTQHTHPPQPPRATTAFAYPPHTLANFEDYVIPSVPPETHNGLCGSTQHSNNCLRGDTHTQVDYVIPTSRTQPTASNASLPQPTTANTHPTHPPHTLHITRRPK